jgi:hypothetical protein
MTIAPELDAVSISETNRDVDPAGSPLLSPEQARSTHRRHPYRFPLNMNKERRFVGW